MKAATSPNPWSINIPRISIHAAREGGDCHGWEAAKNILEFQSTPPVKAATHTKGAAYCLIVISIHAAREGGDDVISDKIAEANISIHAAREGGDV